MGNKKTQNLHHKNYLHLRTTATLYQHINLQKLVKHITNTIKQGYNKKSQKLMFAQRIGKHKLMYLYD